MKKLTASLVCFAFGLFFAASLLAQRVQPSLSASDRAWAELQIPISGLESSKERMADPAALSAVLTIRAASFLAKADQAKAFYTQYPDHINAGTARLSEIRALVSATHSGDATVEGRLASTVRSLRSDKSVSAAIKVQAVSAYGFYHQMQGQKTHEERLNAIEQVARGLTIEFPEQPQGYESLLTVAATTGDEVRAKKIARELLGTQAPASVKDGAQKLLGRFDLIGKSLQAELEGANESAAKSALRSGRPTIIYSWATGSPGSLALAADLKKAALDANIISLNLDTDIKAAEALAQKQGLIGTIIYDERGSEGAFAQRLKIKRASQVYFVDEKGVFRDVRGEAGLKAKLKQGAL